MCNRFEAAPVEDSMAATKITVCQGAYQHSCATCFSPTPPASIRKKISEPNMQKQNRGQGSRCREIHGWCEIQYLL